MPTVNIYIADRGAKLSDGGVSAVGHMWYQLKDGRSMNSYGFAPDQQHHGSPFAPGQVYKNDTENYLDIAYSKTFEISDAEYAVLKSFGEDPTSYGFLTKYNGLNNSCIDFTWKALEAAGINKSRYDGAVWPVWNKSYIEGIWTDYLRSKGLGWKLSISVDETGQIKINPICKPGISQDVNHYFLQGKRDPLMLDLDGDGLELKSADGAVLFDHDGDGVRTATGWIGADDGILVRDVDGDGDGRITSGRELFGDETLKLNGQKAANGFDALADLDSNHDGNFTSADAAWGQVKVWRDLDQDGVSDAGELFTLDQLGISRIGVTGSASNATGGSQAGTTINGNVVAQSASFTQNSNGVAKERTAGSVDLQANTFYRELTQAVSVSVFVSATAQARPTCMAPAGRAICGRRQRAVRR